MILSAKFIFWTVITMLKTLLLPALCLLSTSSFAHWQIDNEQSRVNFVSIKKDTIAEAHFFKSLSGEINDNGQFSMQIDLTSIESNIPIRNTRMQEFLFETAQFPHLTLSANVSSALESIKKGQSKIMSLPANLSLHGVNKEINVEVLITHQITGELIVTSMMPVLINAADFGLTAGIEKLQQLAGLPSIAKAVPVSFVLTLEKH